MKTNKSFNHSEAPENLVQAAKIIVAAICHLQTYRKENEWSTLFEGIRTINEL